MGKFYDEIPAFLVPWIQKQHVFWIATAPLSQDGHVNVSPKGVEGVFHVVNSTRVWYEDLTGSGIETISHIRENGRITVLFNAFTGPPRICRLFGTGTVHEYGTPEYDELLPTEKRLAGSRAVIVIDVHKVGTSCGYAVPFYEFKGHRSQLLHCLSRQEDVDRESSRDMPTNDGAASEDDPGKLNIPEKGLRRYWVEKNNKSIDGIPGLQLAFRATRTLLSSPVPLTNEVFDAEGRYTHDERVPTKTMLVMQKAKDAVDMKTILAFGIGCVVSGLYHHYARAIFGEVRSHYAM